MINSSKENPEANRLSAGVTVEQLETAVHASGYPLQRVVAEELLPDFSVTEEWGYLDRESGAHRGLDLLAYREIRETAQLLLRAALLVECKRSDLPYVFFEAAAPGLPREFPVVAGLHGNALDVRVQGVGSRSSPVAEFLRLADFPFVSNGPPVCASFARAERKGKGKRLDLSGSVPFNQVILPLVSALQHFIRQHKHAGSRTAVSTCVALPVCVVDAPMVSVKGAPGDSQLTMSPWIRAVRQEAVEERHGMSWRYYVVDFVHRAYLSRFVKDHLLPFAEQFAERALAGQQLLRAGQAQVPDLDHWKFEDLRPFAGAG
jgi:hypothetical protein